MFTEAKLGAAVGVVVPAALVVVDVVIEDLALVESSRLEHPATSRPVARTTATEGRRGRCIW
jgi:hypothetical protein